MKHLTLQSPHFIYLEKSFKEWLSIIGYAETTVNTIPIHLREFFYYLEKQHITQLSQLTSNKAYQFISHIKSRKSERTGTALSAASINKIILSINLFVKYVNTTGKHILDITPRKIENDTTERNILTQEEIKALYESTYEPQRQNSKAMGQRDRAIIAIFYGCGLRKEEGTRLNLNDIDTYKGLVFVKKAKGNKQRYVPIATKHLEDIKKYIEEGRNWFLLEHKAVFYYKQGVKKQNTDDEAFFLNMEGKRMNSFYQRIAFMKERSGIEKEFSTHTFRHSIATHLLQSGMPIEEIAKFLGHSSLDSTQIYTHIVNEIANSPGL